MNGILAISTLWAPKCAVWPLEEPAILAPARANDALQREIGERQRAEDALRRANQELEARVQERTAELSAAND